MVLSLIMIMMAFFSVQAIFYIVGDKGIVRILELHAEVDSVNLENVLLAEKNKALEQEIQDIKSNAETLEHVAREELGMIHKGETFFYFTEEATDHHSETP